MVRASIAAEKVGVRSVSIISNSFATQGKLIARALGFENLAFAQYPGVIMLESEEEFRQKIDKVIVEQVIEGLSGSVETVAPPAEPQPRDIVYKGSLDEVQEHFYRKLWSDGLPFVPPTIDRVERFLRFTDRSPDEVIGPLLPEKREATVWNVAVNGVMAGCRPEYMPVLLAVVEAIADPQFRIEDGGSTPGWEPLIIVNGPIVKELDFNYEAGAMRIGRQANSSIGRFLRLYMRNVAGLRIPPGGTDKGTIAFTFNVALAENEDAVAEMGWKPFSAYRGFAAGENVVTVQSVVSISPPIYVGGDKAIDLMQTIGDVWGKGDIAYWARNGLKYGDWNPLLVLGPAVARAIARDGWTKDDIRTWLYENVKVTAGYMERLARQSSSPNFDICQLVEEGQLPAEYCTSSDPERLVRVFFDPEKIGIVVAGDSGRNQCRGYTSNHKQGVPTSKKVKLPANWKQLIG